MTPLKRTLIEHIRETGPITVAQFMAACLYDPRHGYYAREPRIAGDGDFITGPEISQMFGELIGLWCVHEWDVLGRPAPFQLMELGPGNGALIADAWRAARIEPAFRDAAQVHLIEVSNVLRGRQAEALARFDVRARWHERVDAAPVSAGFVIANEFFDCLPIRQFVRTDDGWRERLIGVTNQGELQFGLGGLAQDPLLLRGGGRGWGAARMLEGSHRSPIEFTEHSASPHPLTPSSQEEGEMIGVVHEVAPALEAWVDVLAQRLKSAPGRALIIDYAGDGAGDTLQAVRAHTKESPLEAPGDADLTARVDFVALKILARASGLQVHGPADQGSFLAALGLHQRAEALAAAHPERAARIGREVARLTDADQMGVLFKAICLSSPNLPPPAGF
ncbi:MAG: SAM-dependent methyltransferase [Terricaulis silvestris]